jgi:prepilin-type N-terminal cleavage/methylation domain-containing protein
VANQTSRVRSADGGFTMIEVIVALALITVLMASLGTYFVSSVRVSRHQAQIQAAVRLAQAGMEAARGYGGPTLLVGRSVCTSANCTNVAAYDTVGYLSSMTRWDGGVSGVTPTVPRPDAMPMSELVIPINGVTYSRYHFVGKCWQAATGGACGTNSALPVQMVRLVVGVIWSDANCQFTMCIRAATALFSLDPADPVFQP